MSPLDARSVRTLAVTALTAVGLAACGGGSHSAAVVTPPPPPATLESKFGAGFATAYDASANTEPSTPASTAIIVLSLTTEPIPLS